MAKGNFKNLVLYLFFVFQLPLFSYGNIGDKIVFFAKRFLGIPYDVDPLGIYVRKKVIVYDERVDCMYLIFRSVELAFSDGNDRVALDIALDKRFISRGMVSNSMVVNYETRFEYGEDMILSGKWGKPLITNENILEKVFSRRLNRNIFFVPKSKYDCIEQFIKNGSIIFFIKNPKYSKKNEVVGHMGILEKVSNDVFLIHAKGTKNVGGKVVRENMKDYLESTKYIGFVITYFE
ncbi:MAG: hypothetical protein ACK4F9_00115 [Brevinematia bacterium]